MAWPCKEWYVVVVVVSVLLLGIFTTKCQSQSGQLCPGVSGRPSCVCQSSKGIIDLTPLANKDKPRFTGIPDKNDSKTTYTYNPCYKVEINDHCASDYACSEYSGGTSYDITGDVEELYIDTDGTPYLYYPASPGSLQVNLHCVNDNDSTIVLSGRTGYFGYTFTLSSCQVCPGGCASNSKKVAVTSGYIGIAVILLFLILIAAYLIGGGIFLRVMKGPDSNLVPHKHFWKEVPILIKEGCVLTFTGAKCLFTCGSNRCGYMNVK